MKKSILTWLFFACTSFVIAQTQPIPWKKPVDEQVRVGDVTAFRVGKKWGAYSHVTQKIVAEPVYLLVVANPFGYIGVEKSKMIFANSSGQILKSTTAARMGVAALNNEPESMWALLEGDKAWACKNHAVAMGQENWMPDSLCPNHAAELLRNHQVYWVERWNGFLLVNNKKGQLSTEPYYYLYNNEIRIDSVDANGYLVYPPPLVEIKSYVYDLKKRVQPLSSDKGTWFSAGAGKMFLMSVDYTNNVTTFDVYDKTLVKVFSQAQKDEFFSEELYRWIIPYDKIEKVWNVDKLDSREPSLVFYRVNGKTGLYNHSSGKIVLAPDNDAVFRLVSTQTMVGLKNGKFFILSGDGENRLDAKDSAAVFFKQTRMVESELLSYMAFVNNTGYVFDGYDYIPATAYDSSFLYNEIAGCDLKWPLVFVNDFKPQENSREPYYRIDEMMDYIRIDSVDVNGNLVYPPPIPAIHQSGVYTIAQQLWVVPRKYTACLPAGNYIVGIMRNNFTIAYTLFNPSGTVVTENVSIEKLAMDKTIVSGLCGATVTDVKRIPCDTGNIYEWPLYYQLIVYTTGGCGIFSMENMQWVIKPAYQDLFFQRQTGIWVSYKNDKMGLINQQGQETIPPSYTSLYYSPYTQMFVADDSWCISLTGVESGRPEMASANDVNNRLFGANGIIYDADYQGAYFLNAHAGNGTFKAGEHYYHKQINEIYTYDEYTGEPMYQYDENGNPLLNVVETKFAQTHFFSGGKITLQSDTMAWLASNVYKGLSNLYFQWGNNKSLYFTREMPDVCETTVTVRTQGDRNILLWMVDEYGEYYEGQIKESYVRVFNEDKEYFLPDSLRAIRCIMGEYVLAYALDENVTGTYLKKRTYIHHLTSKKSWLVSADYYREFSVYKMGSAYLICGTDENTAYGPVCIMKPQPGNDTVWYMESAKLERIYDSNLAFLTPGNTHEKNKIINDEGKVLYEGEINIVQQLAANRMAISVSGKYFIIDNRGQRITRDDYTEITTQGVQAYGAETLLLVVKTHGRRQVVDLSGNVLADGDENVQYSFNWPEQYNQRVWEIYNGVTSEYIVYDQGWKKFTMPK